MPLRLLIPFIMLALAALACDGVSYNTIYVADVSSDPTQPGHVQVHVEQNVGNSIDGVTHRYFASTDYGQTWTPTEAFDPAENALPLAWNGEQLEQNGRVLWMFPRAGFRSFFYEWTDDGSDSVIDYFVLPGFNASNAVSGDVLYVSAGTEGILVGPAPGNASSRAWELRQNIPGLRPLPLGFGDPGTVAGVVLAALMIPPLPFIHAYLLSRVWRYLMPAADAWRKALRLSLAFAALAVIAILLWIVPTSFDIGFYPMAITVAIIVVVVSIIMTVRHARGAGVIGGRLWWAGRAAALVASLVPLGVLAVWWLWWLVALLVFGDMTMWALADRHLLRNGIISDPPKPIMHWRTDRLALVSMLIGFIVAAPLVITIAFGRSLLRIDYRLETAVNIISILLLIAVATLALRGYAGSYVHSLLKKDASAGEFRPLPWAYTALALVAWVAITAVASLALFGIQINEGCA